MTEGQLMALFMYEASRVLKHIRVFRRQIVQANIDGRQVRAGIKGQADIYAYSRGGGVIELELKSATGRLSREQGHWRDWCHEWGVPWMLLQAHHGEPGPETVMRWVREVDRESRKA